MGPLCFWQCLHFKNNTPVKICEGTEKRSAVLHLVTFITISRSSPSFCVGAAIFGGGHTFLWLSMIERTNGRIKLLQDIRYLLSLQLLKCSLAGEHFTFYMMMTNVKYYKKGWAIWICISLSNKMKYNFSLLFCLPFDSLCISDSKGLLLFGETLSNLEVGFFE